MVNPADPRPWRSRQGSRWSARCRTRAPAAPSRPTADRYRPIACSPTDRSLAAATTASSASPAGSVATRWKPAASPTTSTPGACSRQRLDEHRTSPRVPHAHAAQVPVVLPASGPAARARAGRAPASRGPPAPWRRRRPGRGPAGTAPSPAGAPGASDLLTEPSSTTRSGARPCSAPDRFVVVAELGVVVVLEDRPRRRSCAHCTSSLPPRVRSGAHRWATGARG